jgi:trans-aconitate methyltransferase
MIAAVNSLSWWNGYFEDQWEANNGRNQTRHFMTRLLDHLASRETYWLGAPGRSILDWGCALGDGVDVLCRRFPAARVSGLDFSRTAIEKAVARYPGYDFQLAEDGCPKTTFDAVFTSNCLEHFLNPFEVAADQLRFCRSLYVAMVPFREQHLHEAHFTRFELDTFPDAIGGFRKLGSAILRCPPLYWNGEQIIVTYGSAPYCDEARLA